jgi:hypothetical protein
MVLAVVAKVVPLLDKRFYAFRVGLDPATGHEKGHLHVVSVQHIHDFLEIVRAPR